MEKHFGQVSHVAVLKQHYLIMLQTIAAEIFRFFSPTPASKATMQSFSGDLRQLLLKTSKDLIKKGKLNPAVAQLFKISNKQRVAMVVKMILDIGYAIRFPGISDNEQDNRVYIIIALVHKFPSFILSKSLVKANNLGCQTARHKSAGTCDHTL